MNAVFAMLLMEFKIPLHNNTRVLIVTRVKK